MNCGTGYQVGVDALDAAGNASPQATMSVTTSACTDTQPPTAPSNVNASNRTTTSISLTWAPATDNIGVAAYGIYNGANLIDTTAGTTGIISDLTCGTNYTLAVDAFDATRQQLPQDHHHGLHPPLHRHHRADPADKPQSHVHDHHQRHTRLERRHRQRRRHRLRRLPRRQPKVGSATTPTYP